MNQSEFKISVMCRVLRVSRSGYYGWRVRPRSARVIEDAQLMADALQIAVQNRCPKNVIHHSDPGTQYTSHEFQQACAVANVILSMGSVGDCYDNAMAESFFATLETELIDEQPRARFRTRTEAWREVFRYMEGYYNRCRTHSTLGYQTPLKFERKYAEE